MNDNVVAIGDGRKKPTTPVAAAGDLYPPPDAPLDVARKFYAETYDHGGLRTLVHYRGDWWVWTGQHWTELDHSALKSAVYERLGAAHYMKETRKNGVVLNEEETAWNPTRNKIANVIEALAAVAHLDASTTTPAFIADHDQIGDAGQVIACTNGLVSLHTRQLTAHTPALFNVVSVTFDYDPQAPKPQAWLAFLDSVWPDDPDSIALLQEWIAYVLTGRTDLQKILLLIGPSRSGKGTIARLVRKLIGHLNVAGPTLASLGTNFGLWPLVGKPLAIIADARLGGVPQAVIVERLLSISGEDLLTIDRKNKAHWIGTLPTRIMILSNEVPHFNDSSGAIANRFMALRMRRSFLGGEDIDLDARLAAELPGILNWALDGLDRLTSNRRFTIPKSSTTALATMRELASPVGTFVREYCTTNPDDRVERDTLYRAWLMFANSEGYIPGDKARFGRDLNAVVPGLGTEQPRIGNARIRSYTGIALLPVPPVPGSETPAQAPKMNPPLPVPPPATLFADTGSGTGNAQKKPQVNAPGTGGTGESASRSQLHNASDETGRPKAPCTKWLRSYLRTVDETTTSTFALQAAAKRHGYTQKELAVAISTTGLLTKIDRQGHNRIYKIIEPDAGYPSATAWVHSYLDALPANTDIIDQGAFYTAADDAEIPRDTARKLLVRSGRIESLPAHGQARNDRVWKIKREETA